jgi:hypothetical protein
MMKNTPKYLCKNCKRERERVCLCVCVCERERENESDGVKSVIELRPEERSTPRERRERCAEWERREVRLVRGAPGKRYAPIERRGWGKRDRRQEGEGIERVKWNAGNAVIIP